MRQTIFTIPPGHSFVDSLALGLIERAEGDPARLASFLVLLPNRRACRSLREAFLRQGGGAPMLLPRMMPIGEVDEDELVLAGDGLAESLDLPPALSPSKRRLALARLILALGEGRGGHAPGPDQAVRLADELAGLLDSVQTERLSFASLVKLVPEDLAEHWRITVDFLAILSDLWPVILAEQGTMDAAQRRNLLLEAQIRLWRETPPDFPVIAAGSTGSIPAAADLIATIATLPTGLVVLPGLDQRLDEASWQKVDESHPQFGLKQLLDAMGATRDGIADWTAQDAPRPHRLVLMSEALRPAATTEAWRDLPALPADALAGLSRIDCPGPREEAGIIALMMRESLDHEGRTAALVTPDRNLARRVAGELERWGLKVDDSAGKPLHLTPPGVYLRLVAEMAAQDCAPFPLLAALKHPMSAGAEDASKFRAKVRRLERAVLRGPRPAPGIAGLRRALPEAWRSLDPWLAHLERMLAPLAALMAEDAVSLERLVRVHMETAETLAASDRLPGPARLWKGEAGEVAAQFAADLADAAPLLHTIPPRSYPALLDAMMAGIAVRPSWGGHTRLHIWGPMEARLQHADLVILGGLNEGTWPGEARSDPWMSRPMRKAFGLPPPERRIGLAAHDFAQGFCAPHVVLTRSLKVDGAPSVPSRWLLRLDTVIRAAGLLDDETVRAEWEGAGWGDMQALLDRPDRISGIAPPAPRPPVAARPRKLSVTEIETWMRDPYGIYAKRILELKALDAVDADPGAADYGNLVHDALEHFVKQNPGPLGDGALETLLEIGRDVFRDAMAQPGIWAFWWPRFERIAVWFIAQEQQRRPELAQCNAEIWGELALPGPAGPFTVFAKADRVDQRHDGGLDIIDYKTGQPPSPKEVAAGFSPQLPLEAAIARVGGFKDVPAGEISHLVFWRLSGNDQGGEAKSAGADCADLADQAVDGLKELIAAFDDENTPYEARPHPDKAPKYSDYLHLARVKEWASSGNDGED